MSNRRAFLTGMAGILAYSAAPSIVRASSLMPIKMAEVEYEYFGDPFWGVGFYLPKGYFGTSSKTTPA